MKNGVWRLSGHFGAWGAAESAIQKALTAAGLRCEFVEGASPSTAMLALNVREAQVDQDQAVSDRFDEAGMLLVDEGAADIGVNFREQVDWARRGFGHHEGQPHTNLRGIMSLGQPQFVGFAATWESGITSLEAVAQSPRPIRLLTVSRSRHQTRFMGIVHGRVMEQCGFTQESVLGSGGAVYTADGGMEAILEDRVDLVGLPAYSNWGPAWGEMWMQLQIRRHLRFLPIPGRVRSTLCSELGIREGVLPAGLFRGLEDDTPTFMMRDHTVITNADVSEADVYEITKAIHEHSHFLQEGSVPFAYNPATALDNLGVPVHPGALRFYEKCGYAPSSS